MNNLDGIKDFIKENKEFLEKMNQEMKSNYGQAPLVCLTIEEAEQVKALLDDAVELHDKGVVVIQSSGFKTIHLINERIKQVEMSIAST